MTTPETIDRDLALLDEALESGTATATDPYELELQELALALAAEAPEPDTEFGTELEQRVVRGFPRARPRVHARGIPTLRRLAAPAAALALLAAVAVPAALLSSGDGSDDSGLGGGGGRAAAPAAERQAAGGSALSAPPSRGGGIAPREGNRRIERAAALTLAAPGGRLEKVADGVIAVTDRHRGFVLRSSVTSGEDGPTGGHFELRIPNRRLQPALRDLSALADVRARSQTGDDVTRAFVTTEDRLDAARAERRGLLRRLETSDTDREARAIRERLNLVSGEIRGVQAQLRELRERTTYAAVSVDLEEDADADGGGAGAGGGGTRDAFDDALNSLVGSFNLAVRVLGVAIPVALLAVLAWLDAHLLRRRRREAALGLRRRRC
jgi:Domain of unknown function (DUF4349)